MSWVVVLLAVVVMVGLAARSRSSRGSASATREDAREGPVDREPSADRDNWEGAFWEVRNPLDVDTLVHLSYTDGNGNRTERVVRTRSFDDRPSGLLIGHCQLRDATRTFRFNRVR